MAFKKSSLWAYQICPKRGALSGQPLYMIYSGLPLKVSPTAFAKKGFFLWSGVISGTRLMGKSNMSKKGGFKWSTTVVLIENLSKEQP